MSNFSLKHRIIIAFTIQTLLISIVAFSTISFYVDYMEETVLYRHLARYLDAYVNELDNKAGPIAPVDIKIYIEGNEQNPSYIRNIANGGQEVELENGLAYYVLKKQYGERVFVLVADQTEFEYAETSIYYLVLFVIALFLVVSFVFSRSLAERIVHPIVNLSEKVLKLNVDNINHVQLNYANDEVGALVKVIYDHIYTLNHYLQREKWFTGDISHELRTPMMIISSSMDLLKQSATTAEQKVQIYQRIEDAIKSVNELISTFLILARGHSTEQDGNTDTDLHTLTSEAIENLSSYAKNRRIRFKIIPAEPVIAVVNDSLFSIVLTNLLKNAIFNTDEGEIRVILQATGFEVTDTGKGLPDTIKQFINGQEVATTRMDNKHHGLGLSIVKRVCEREGWKIAAFDNEQGGASFRIDFLAGPADGAQ